MKVREGEVLICGTDDCQVELKVTKSCQANTCGEACEIEATCCNENMTVKQQMPARKISGEAAGRLPGWNGSASK